MALSTFWSNFLRKETFWIGFALYFCGLLVPNDVAIGDIGVGYVILSIGTLLMTTLIVASVLVILWSAFEGWRYGYAEGRS